MGDLEIIGEQPLTMVEVNEELDKVEKRDKELTARAVKTKEYLKRFIELDKKHNDESKKKLQELGLPRLKERLIIKIIDIQPKDTDSLKALFTGENITFKQEELQKVLECIK